MALTKPKIREILSAAGVPADKIDGAVDEIMDGHVTSINALREERDGYKTDAEKLSAVQRELDELKAKPDDGFKEKYEHEHEEHEKLKAKVAKDATNAVKDKLYRVMLADIGVDPKRIDAIMKVTDLDSLNVKDNKLDGEDKLREKAKSDWSDFVTSTGSKGAKPETPPSSGSPNVFEQMSLAEKMKYANEHPTDQSVMNWLGK